MRLITKLIMAAAIFYLLIIAHQENIHARVSRFNKRFDTLYIEYMRLASPAKSCPESVLDRLKVEVAEAEFLVTRLGCWDEKAALPCMRLLHQEELLKTMLLVALVANSEPRSTTDVEGGVARSERDLLSK